MVQPVTRLRNVAVVLAGGTGTRVGLNIPKQLIKIAGKPIIEHTIAAMQPVAAGRRDPRHDGAGLPRRRPGDRQEGRVRQGHPDPGGGRHPQRHDRRRARRARRRRVQRPAARRGPAPGLADDHRGQRRGAADPRGGGHRDPVGGHGDPSRRPAEESIADVLPRHLLRRGQTPQSFRLSTIRAAYAKAAQDPNFTATDDCTVVLRYLPEVPIAVVAGHERNMKVTEPIDVYIADKLFQLTSADRPTAADRRGVPGARLDGKTIVVFGGSYGIGGDIAELARAYGANVKTFSRSTTGTHVESEPTSPRRPQQVLDETGRIDFVVNTAGVLSAASWPRRRRRRSTPRPRSTTWRRSSSPRSSSRISRESGGSLLLFTSSSYTRGRSGYSLYSSAKAAMVNLTQALADEWAAAGVRVNCVNPERTGTPMRTKAFGEEPPGTLLSSEEVARQSLDVLLSRQTGHIIDIRREEGPAALANG